WPLRYRLRSRVDRAERDVVRSRTDRDREYMSCYSTVSVTGSTRISTSFCNSSTGDRDIARTSLYNERGSTNSAEVTDVLRRINDHSLRGRNRSCRDAIEKGDLR